MPLPILLPYFFGREAQPVGDIVLAAVSHHTYFEVPSHVSDGLPVWLLEVAV
jgi:hypothetical protein